MTQGPGARPARHGGTEAAAQPGQAGRQGGQGRRHQRQERRRRTKADVKAAKARQAQAEAAVKLAEVQLGYATIKAPSDGTVVNVVGNAGANAAPGRTLLTMTDPADLFVRVFVPEPQIGQVVVGHGATITTNSSTETFTGHRLLRLGRRPSSPRTTSTPPSSAPSWCSPSASGSTTPRAPSRPACRWTRGCHDRGVRPDPPVRRHRGRRRRRPERPRRGGARPARPGRRRQVDADPDARHRAPSGRRATPPSTASR